jgi:TfoX/Sxy family transcriptional regulator of competence genes
MYNQKLTEKLRKALAHLPDVEEKKMFRGVVFMVNGRMCISAGDDEIMCRIDPSLHDDLIKKNGCRSVIMKNREYKGYIYIKEDNLKNKNEFDYWIGLALEFNKKAKASKKGRSN